MKLSIQHTLLTAALLAGSSQAFTPAARPFTRGAVRTGAPFVAAPATSSLLQMSVESDKAEAKDDEIERLRSMAAQLRAEAAALEAEQAQTMATAAERVFAKFDKNQDGEVSLAELKEGLEKEFKQELPEKRVQQLMADFDKSGDGALQKDEFVTLNKFRNKLDALAREERALAIEKRKQASVEEEAANFLKAQLEQINDKPPTNTDKLVSILPYLFPLLDGFQYARFLIFDNAENPLVLAGALLYSLYQAIPFGGFIAFFSLYFLAGRPNVNRLVRFNAQQAIFLDIALFFPGLATALIGMSGVSIPPQAAALGNDAIFFTLLAAIVYAVGSSALGQTPDKIPFISDAVNARVPTADSIINDIDSWQFSQKDGVLRRVNGDDDSKKEEKKKEETKEDEKVNKE